MIAITKKAWDILDATNPLDVKTYNLPPGKYKLQRIKCPIGHNCHWLVLKDTKIGASEGWWRQWKNGDLADNPAHSNYGKPINWGKFEIVIEE